MTPLSELALVRVRTGMNSAPVPVCLVCAHAFPPDAGLGDICPACDWEIDPLELLGPCECGTPDWSAANAQCVGEARWQWRAWLRRSRMAPPRTMTEAMRSWVCGKAIKVTSTR